MNKIKVLHVTQASVGGTLEYIKNFIIYSNKDKFENIVICPSYGPISDDIKSIGCKVINVEMFREINLVKDIKSCIDLNRKIKEIKPDIIHFHSTKAGAIGRIIARKNNIPCIYNAHGWAFSMKTSTLKKKLYIYIEKFLSRFTDYIINISKSEKDLAEKYNIASKEKMKLIFNGIDIKKFKDKDTKYKNRETLEIPREAFVIGMVGRLTKQKSPETFVEFSKEIIKDIKNSYFILVGDGELKEEVEKLIKEAGIEDKFMITGWVNNSEDYIVTFDIGLLTSSWEGFGLVIAEYMASKVPVIVSAVGGINDIIVHGENGFKVQNNNVYDYLKYINLLKDNEKLRKYIIDNAYKEVNEKYDMDRVVKEHEEIYSILLKKYNCKFNK